MAAAAAPAGAELYINSASRHLVRAVTLEKQPAQQAAALESYLTGISVLLDGVKGDADPRRARAVKTRVAEYLLQAEQIRAMLESESRRQQQQRQQHQHSVQPGLLAATPSSQQHHASRPQQPLHQLQQSLYPQLPLDDGMDADSQSRPQSPPSPQPASPSASQPQSQQPTTQPAAAPAAQPTTSRHHAQPAQPTQPAQPPSQLPSTNQSSSSRLPPSLPANKRGDVPSTATTVPPALQPPAPKAGAAADAAEAAAAAAETTADADGAAPLPEPSTLAPQDVNVDSVLEYAKGLQTETFQAQLESLRIALAIQKKLKAACPPALTPEEAAEFEKELSEILAKDQG